MVLRVYPKGRGKCSADPEGKAREDPVFVDGNLYDVYYLHAIFCSLRPKEGQPLCDLIYGCSLRLKANLYDVYDPYDLLFVETERRKMTLQIFTMSMNFCSVRLKGGQ